MIVKDIEERGSGPLLSEIHEKIAWIVFNNPQRMNAMSQDCLLYTSPSPRDGSISRMPSSA